MLLINRFLEIPSKSCFFRIRFFLQKSYFTSGYITITFSEMLIDRSSRKKTVYLKEKLNVLISRSSKDLFIELHDVYIHNTHSLILRPSPSFPSLVVWYCKRREAG